jgi:hypothetical protein
VGLRDSATAGGGRRWWGVCRERGAGAAHIVFFVKSSSFGTRVDMMWWGV